MKKILKNMFRYKGKEQIPITPLQETPILPNPTTLELTSSRKMSSSLKTQVSMLNPTPLELSSSRKKRVDSGQLDSLKYNIIKFITNGCSEIVPYIIQEKHKKSIETQIDIINAAIIATKNEEVNKLFYDLKVNFRDNTASPTIFIDYSQIFCNSQLSNICKAFIELQSIYTFYTYHDRYISQITYQFEKPSPSNIFEYNLVQYINNPNITYHQIIGYYYTEFWGVLSNYLHNPSFATKQKKCLYYYDKTIINYVQSIIDVYNEFVRFISENKIENEPKISDNIFQQSIDKLNNIYLNTNINTIIINDETNKKAILEIIEKIRNEILPEIKKAFNYLQDLYFPERVNVNNYFRKQLGLPSAIKGGNTDTIDYTYNNKTYNRKIRYDGKKKYIIINKSRIYLKKS